MKSLITKNFFLKLFSILLAISLEYYFYSPENSQLKTQTLKLTVSGVEEGLKLVSPKQITMGGVPLEVTLKGPKPLIKNLDVSGEIIEEILPVPNPLYYSIDTRDLPLKIPSGIKVISIEPSFINLRFEPIEVKNVNIKLNIINDLTGDFLLNNIEINPKTVEIRGPKSEVSKIDTVSMIPLYINDSNLKNKHVSKLRQLGGSIELLTDEVEVMFNIEQKSFSFSLSNHPVEVKKDNNSVVELSRDGIDIIIRGPESLAKDFKSNNVKVLIDAKGLAPGRHILEPEIELPEGFKIEQTTPSSFTVNIKKSL